MKIKYNIYAIGAALALFTACSDDVEPVYTVGEAVNAITLHAGISEGVSGVQTRAVDDNHNSTDNGGGHVAFNPSPSTQLRLRVDGTWTGKGDGNISKTTTATIGGKTGTDQKHNEVSFSTTTSPVEQLYWDDYGTADPDNKGTGNGREKGLTIYGVAVEGVSSAPAVTDWNSLSWTLGLDQTSNWSSEDLLTSNNIRPTENGGDGTYKFDDYVNDLKNSTNTASSLLEFTHAMTKITVVLKAGEGFPGYTSANPDNAKFEGNPTVTLKSFYYTGNVNIESKTSTATTTQTDDIKMHLADGGKDNLKATLDALVFPGNTFSATIADDENNTPTSDTKILELNADGNIYEVTAAQLVKAIAGTSTTGTPVDGTLEQGKNYILGVTVNKTKIEVTATIKDWESITAEEAKPKINVTATYGYTVAQGGSGVTEFTNNYDLFRSITKAAGYDDDGSTDGINPAARFNNSAWDKNIYWPNHQTHYFFRGVYPAVGTSATGTTLADEAVTKIGDNDVVAVTNATYTADTYPSDLAIAIPRKTDGTLDETCNVTAHSATSGICATEGIINLNFEYAMSKVEVRLKSSATDASHINLTKDNTKVEIIGGYNKGRIKLSDGLHDSFTDADKGAYTLTNLTDPASGALVTTLDAIIPQEIGDDVVFRITVITNDQGNADPSDDEVDVYECKVKLIKEDNDSTPIEKWEHGKNYIYILDLNKTAIKVTATIKNWVEATASEDVWF